MKNRGQLIFLLLGTLLGFLLLILLSAGCSPLHNYQLATHQGDPHDTSSGDLTHLSEPGARVVVPKGQRTLPAPFCDPQFQKHVYNPERLTHVQECVVVTGIVVDATHGKQKDGARHETDGDNHSWLRLDKPYENLLNDGNRQFEEGNMVYELQCLFKVTQADAKAACRNWKNPLELPPLLTHIRIWGTLVTETNHGKWREIHPVAGWELINPSKWHEIHPVSGWELIK